MRARILLVFCVIVCAKCALRTDQQFWKNLALQELDEALNVKLNLGTARNVIVFLGDGMDPNTVTATRIYKGGETHRLSFEKFPHIGLLKTYSANKMVTDSAASATALFCGVKANQQTIGVDANVPHKDCVSSLDPRSRLQSLAALALTAGKSADFRLFCADNLQILGLVTTVRVTHATPGPLYAHSADRRWECEDNMPTDAALCKDIARQLVEDWPGRDLNVVMGGGRQVLVSNVTGTASNPLDTWSCRRNDGRNLIEEYEQDKKNRGLKHSVVTNNKELKDLDVDNTDYLLGIFSNGHLPYEHARNTGPEGTPSLSEMVEAAIKVLSKNENGYFLMVEGGNIDMAHHRGWAKRAVYETAAMEDAVQLADSLTDDQDTLLIVTSDHGHTLAINGYPYRGSSIFGITPESDYDGVNYTTLAYTTGGPNAFQYYVQTDGEGATVARREPSLEDTESLDYVQVAAIRAQENTHGGGDMVIYAKGPQAHLFHNVHEQHYMYHAVAHIAKLGVFSEDKNSANHYTNSLTFISLIIVINLIL